MLVSQNVLHMLNTLLVLLFTLYIIITYTDYMREKYINTWKLWTNAPEGVIYYPLVFLLVAVSLLNIASLLSNEKYMIGPNRLPSSEYKRTDMNPAQGDAQTEPTLFNTLKEGFATQNLPLWTPRK